MALKYHKRDFVSFIMGKIHKKALKQSFNIALKCHTKLER